MFHLIQAWEDSFNVGLTLCIPTMPCPPSQTGKRKHGTKPSTWVFPKNMGTPKSSILIKCSTINHLFWGTGIFGNYPHLSMVDFLFFADGSNDQTALVGRMVETAVASNSWRSTRSNSKTTRHCCGGFGSLRASFKATASQRGCETERAA